MAIVKNDEAVPLVYALELCSQGIVVGLVIALLPVLNFVGANSNVMCHQYYRYLRKQLARGDIYDALVNAVTATRLDKMIKTLPPEPTKDTLGLPMQMVYTLP